MFFDKPTIKVLVVEDDPMQLAAISALLKNNQDYNIDLITETTSSKGLGHKPDLAILDLNILDDMSGLTLCERLREEDPSVTVLIYTADLGYHYTQAISVADYVFSKTNGIQLFSVFLDKILNEISSNK